MAFLSVKLLNHIFNLKKVRGGGGGGQNNKYDQALFFFIYIFLMGKVSFGATFL